MKVKITKAFRHRGQILEVGTVLTIRPEDYPRLYLKVVPIEPVATEVMEAEYLHLLAAWWKLDTDPDSMTMDDTRRTFDRLDELYRSLRSNGRNPPIRLPIERNRAEVQRELAL
jgi:hypothetical protein